MSDRFEEAVRAAATHLGEPGDVPDYQGAYRRGTLRLRRKRAALGAVCALALVAGLATTAQLDGFRSTTIETDEVAIPADAIPSTPVPARVSDDAETADETGSAAETADLDQARVVTTDDELLADGRGSRGDDGGAVEPAPFDPTPTPDEAEPGSDGADSDGAELDGADSGEQADGQTANAQIAENAPESDASAESTPDQTALAQSPPATATPGPVATTVATTGPTEIPTPTATVTPAPSPTRRPALAASPSTGGSSPTATATAVPTAIPTPTPSPTVAPAPSPVPSSTAVPAATPSPTPTAPARVAATATATPPPSSAVLPPPVYDTVTRPGVEATTQPSPARARLAIVLVEPQLDKPLPCDTTGDSQADGECVLLETFPCRPDSVVADGYQLVDTDGDQIADRCVARARYVCDTDVDGVGDTPCRYTPYP